MKKTILICIFLYTIVAITFGQQSQITEDPYYYQVKGYVTVKEFDLSTRTKTTIQKTPMSPLRFKIVGEETDQTDHTTYYIIQFLAIKSESDETIVTTVTGPRRYRTKTRRVVSTLKGSAIFINSDDNDKLFWLKKEELDSYITKGFIFKSYKIPSATVSYGANISLPFKLRSKTDGQNIKITPDLTLGGYLGVKWRLVHTKPYYVTAPVISLGVATLSINDNNTSTLPNKGDGAVLGITGSTGLVFQLDKFQFGLILGWDRAAGEIGKDWIYNNKTWYSFSIGYTFLGNGVDNGKGN